jgi:hypothetical protein
MSLRFDPPDNVPTWEPLSPGEQQLVARLWRGELPTASDVAIVARLFARHTGHDGCWQLAMSEQTGAVRRVHRGAPYVGDATDLDGCLVQAVLVLDEQGLPLELEFVRLDGAPIQAELRSLTFALVEE